MTEDQKERMQARYQAERERYEAMTDAERARYHANLARTPWPMDSDKRIVHSNLAIAYASLAGLDGR